MEQPLEQKLNHLQKLLGVLGDIHRRTLPTSVVTAYGHTGRESVCLYDLDRDKRLQKMHAFYRLGEVEDALDRLWSGQLEPEHGGLLAKCVHFEYVEPFPQFMPGRRQELAEAGLKVLAHAIDGALPDPAESRAQAERALRRERDAEIVRLHRSGQSEAFLARHYHLTRSELMQILEPPRPARASRSATASGQRLRAPSRELSLAWKRRQLALW